MRKPVVESQIAHACPYANLVVLVQMSSEYTGLGAMCFEDLFTGLVHDLVWLKMMKHPGQLRNPQKSCGFC
eukprot:CAMPEP_0114288550 /NCGR_PEP_ID=MMETSP0059-20121206/6877_1 /TAXON_ID=36894 /ORGANISM="Pyramimonas parkeae, Strain CCMP726" /LENGTH=70 /DNA_ID=CAMNT_0001409717 /DNA_START=84 /DNA_END=293 /DNA_ORIENTATION=+